MRFAYTTPFPNIPPRPYLDVVLRNQFSTTPPIASLVDSGAGYPIFPAELADDLRLDLTECPIWRFCGTTGAIQEARLAEVTLNILHENDIDLAFECRTICAFCETLNFGAGALLGQNGFFSVFKTTFHQPSNFFEIERWEDEQ